MRCKFARDEPVRARELPTHLQKPKQANPSSASAVKAARFATSQLPISDERRQQVSRMPPLRAYGQRRPRVEIGTYELTVLRANHHRRLLGFLGHWERSDRWWWCLVAIVTHSA